MEANSKATVLDTEKFPRRGASGGDSLSQLSSASEIANPTGAIPSNKPLPSSHQPSTSVDGHFQRFNQRDTSPNGYLYHDVNNWQEDGVSTRQSDDYSQQATPTETPIGQGGNPYIGDNSNLIIDPASQFGGNSSVPGAVDWPVNDALPQTAQPTYPTLVTSIADSIVITLQSPDQRELDVEDDRSAIVADK